MYCVMYAMQIWNAWVQLKSSQSDSQYMGLPLWYPHVPHMHVSMCGHYQINLYSEHTGISRALSPYPACLLLVEEFHWVYRMELQWWFWNNIFCPSYTCTPHQWYSQLFVVCHLTLSSADLVTFREGILGCQASWVGLKLILSLYILNH